MGDLQNGETMPDRVYVQDSTTYAAVTGIAGLLTCNAISPSNVLVPLTVVEVGYGVYEANLTPDADGVWCIIWTRVTGYLISHYYKYVKVGGGDLADVAAAVIVIDGLVDTLISRLTATRAAYIDNLSGGAVALNSDIQTLLNRLSATKSGYLDAAISSRSSHSAADIWSVGSRTLSDYSGVWAVGSRALTDKANFTLASGEYDNIRKSVCLTGDTANSIGKILYDFYVTRLTATRTAYIDNLSAGAAALEATLTAMKGAGWSTETLVVIAANIATIMAKTNNLPSDPTSASVVAADFDRHLTPLTFWSATDDLIAITAAADQDYDLPDVTVPTLPTGFTIWRVELLFKCSLIRDTSGADNAIDEAGTIRVKKDGDADFDADGITAYNIVDNMWAVDVTNVGRDRGGDGFAGNIDIKAKVDGADTYNIRLDSISADGGNLELHEVAVGLRIWVY